MSHSHWDREWYESFEQHRMKLVELIDDLIELFEKDGEFKSFHLDGQVILLDDYLEIKPQNRSKLKELVKSGKLVIGPFYILQDELLLTGEENVRNGLIGQSYTKEWGENLCKVGYFPDTFGHIGQLPQICTQMGMKYAFFGRGVKPIGFDNQVLEEEAFASPYSEMYIEGPDGSRILGILFANWYSNGNEIPVDEAQAKIFWEEKFKTAGRFASTDSLLMMNGCDHQPVQKNLSQALAVARKLYPDVTFLHSSLEAYAQEVEGKLSENLQVIKGEMTSQETDGWYTLANTASSRIYLKEANMKLADDLTQVVEPISLWIDKLSPYRKEHIDYGWRKLMENLPHDSICGCSIDEVHKEMEVRFEKASSTTNYLIEEALDVLDKDMEIQLLEEGDIPLLIVNPSPNPTEEYTSMTLPIHKFYFKDMKQGPVELFHEVNEMEKKHYQLVDQEGNLITGEVTFKECRFGYDLPKDKFRQPYIAQYYQLLFYKPMSPFGKELIYLREVKESQNRTVKKSPNEALFENPYYALSVKDGKVIYQDKQNEIEIDDLIRFEDRGDVGNEYIYMSPQGEAPIWAELIEVKEKVSTQEMVILSLQWDMMIPSRMEEIFEFEKRSLVEFKSRKARRIEADTHFKIEVELKLFKDSRAIFGEVNFDNQQMNHRLRMVIATQRNNLVHFADSSFEIVERSNAVSKFWKNPSNPQHMLKLVGMEDEKGGLIIGVRGLQEYELIEDNHIAITLLRSVDELGDWGDFPTKDSLELGVHTRHFVIESYSPEGKLKALKSRLMTGISPLVKLCQPHHGLNQLSPPYVEQSDAIFYTTCKKRENGQGQLVRYLNISKEEQDFKAFEKGFFVNLLEEIWIESGKIPTMGIRTEVQ